MTAPTVGTRPQRMDPLARLAPQNQWPGTGGASPPLWFVPGAALLLLLVPATIAGRVTGDPSLTVTGAVVTIAATVLGSLPGLYRFVYRRRSSEFLRDLPLHWRDWRAASMLRDMPEDRLYTLRGACDAQRLGLYPPRLDRLVEIANAIDPDRLLIGLHPKSLEGWEAIAALMRAGLPHTHSHRGIEGLTHGQSAHFLQPADVLAIFDEVPDLTVEDLVRFSRTEALLIRGKATGRVWRVSAVLNDLYCKHGERASYYAALGMTAEEQRQSTEQQVPVETLKAMVGLTSAPVA